MNRYINSNFNRWQNIKWNIKDALVVLLLSFIITAALQIILTYVISCKYMNKDIYLTYETFIKISTEFWYIVGLIMVLDSLFFIAFPIFWVRIKHYGDLSILGLNFNNWIKNFVIGAGYGIVFAGIFTIPHLQERFNYGYDPTKFDIYVYWFIVTKMFVLGPVGEELLFTGFIFPALAKRIGSVLSAIIVSTVFVVCYHPQIWFQFFSMLIVFLMKIIGIWLFLKKKTLIAPIGFHIGYNIIAFIGEVIRSSG
jgi:membrane protease YdiL (CAAX protease family)